MAESRFFRLCYPPRTPPSPISHAWSKDGSTWSEPRTGAYNTTVQFTDGTSMTCVRRERPQMVLDRKGVPLVMFAGVVGCPVIQGTPYKGGGDCFTLAQLMNTD